MEDTPTPSTEKCPEGTASIDPREIAGRYSVSGSIGEGGMGRVYRAMDDVLKRQVAIKVLPFQDYTDEQFKRFQQEARATSKLNHPGIVTVFDFGVTEEREPFLVMDYVDGKPLNVLLEERGSLEIEEWLSIFQQIAKAMSHAHSKGIIHRDLKPSNIIIKDDSDGLKAQILDFGIAKILDDTTSITNTKTGMVMGSPRCISPEQASGGVVDERSDIYSLGCVMYEMLTGSPVFQGSNAMETMFKHMNEEPPKLSTLLEESSSELELIFEKTLAKSPEDRFQSMEELAKALDGNIGYESEEEEQAPEQLDVIDSVQSPQQKSRAFIWVSGISIPLFGIVFFLMFFRSPAPERNLEFPLPINSSGDILKNIPDELIKKTKDISRTPSDIKTLNLRETNISESNLDELARMKQLNHLDLGDCSLPPSRLKKIAKVSTLTSLNLGGTMIDDKDLEDIAGLKNLQELYLLHNSKLTNKGLEHLSVLSELKVLELSGIHNFSESGLDLLVKNNSKISEFRFRKVKITKPVLEAIARMPGLKTLVLTKSQFAQYDLASLSSSKSISSIDLSETLLTNNGLKYLSNLKSLKELKVNKTRVSESGIKWWQQQRPDCNIYCKPKPVASETKDELIPISKGELSVVTDNMRTGEMTQTVNEIIGSKKSEPALEDRLLWKDFNRRWSEHDSHLNLLRNGSDADLKECTRLAITHANLTKSDWERLSKCVKLKQLNLAFVEVSDENLQSLAELKNLEFLVFKYAKVTPDGLKVFKGNRHLWVKVTGCKAFEGQNLSELRKKLGIKWLTM